MERVFPNPQSAIRNPQSRGMVLITVLWVILILSLVSFSLASAVRVEVASSQQSFDSERAFFMAKGAADVIYNGFSKKQELPEDSPVRRENGVYVFPFDSGEARVNFESAAGYIDLNSASDKLLASMFDSLGIDQERRNRLVDSILDWRDADDIPHLYGAEVNDYPQNSAGTGLRPRNGAFQSVDELTLVKNITPEIFHGAFVLDPVTGRYRRIAGVRHLVTVFGKDKVNLNEASYDVLMALPLMTSDIAERVIAERTENLFADATDLVTRVPELLNQDTLDYVSFDSQLPTALVSRATIAPSGVSRTVRLLFKHEEKVRILTYMPLVYKKTQEVTFDRWRFE